MRIFRISNFLSLLVATMFGVLLFWTSQAVQIKEDKLSDLNKNLSHERETLRVLGVEWDYLNRPQRLEKLATEQLGMEPPSSNEIVRHAGDIPEPIIVNTNPNFFEEGGVAVQSVAMEPAKPQAAKATPAPKKETVSPAKAEKETFYDLMNSLTDKGGRE